MYSEFSLVLRVNHSCNMRCTYCYAGRQFPASMSEDVGRQAIDRAIASLGSAGALSLGFIGGEPLLEAELISSLLVHARSRAAAAGVSLRPGLTTNGTVMDAAAWSLMTRPDLDLAVSHDGLPGVHDRHRRFADGRGTSDWVVTTLRWLLAVGKDVSVVMVVRPDTADLLPDGMAFLRDMGVRHVEPSLDLWTRWSAADVTRLEAAIARTADLWRDSLPDFGIGWFDEKAARLARVPVAPSARCGFGNGEIAVAPSGRLYPCERLIGEDGPADPLRLPGHALDGDDFLGCEPPAGRCAEACSTCTIQSLCNTTCRCSNYVRTGCCGSPDGLLCAWNQACTRETARALDELSLREAHQPPAACVAGHA